MGLQKRTRAWPALNVGQLTRLGIELCHTRHRVDILGGGSEAGRSGASAMCGRLIAYLMQLYQKHYSKGTTADIVPTQTGLVKAAKLRNQAIRLSDRDVSQFVAGRPKYGKHSESIGLGGVFWYERTWDWIEDILLGPYPRQEASVSRDQLNLMEEMRTYFMGTVRGKYPEFFSYVRRTCAGPYTEEEARDGIRWLIREQVLTGASQLIVFVSGGAAFLQGSSHEGSGLNWCGEDTIRMVEGGSRAVFVYPDPAVVGTTPASRSIELFFAALINANVSEDTLERVQYVLLNPAVLHRPTPDSKQQLWAGEYLCRWTIFAYLERQKTLVSEQEPTNVLYFSLILRNSADHAFRPFAERAARDVVPQFQEWLRGFTPEKPKSVIEWQRERTAR